MTSREVAKITTHKGTVSFLNQNSSVFENYTPLVDQKNVLSTLVLEETELAKTQSLETGGHADNKIEAKKAMSDKAAVLSGVALVAFKKKGLALEASQLHISSSDYWALPDVESAILASSTYDFLTEQLSVISPDYITADELAELEVLITDFESFKNKVTNVKQTSPSDTKALKVALRSTDEVIADIRLLARKYKDSHPTFYQKLVAVSTPPAVAVHHTTFSAKVSSKPEGIPVTNAVASLTTSNKQGNSDASGFLTIEQVRSGVAALTVQAPGFKELVLQINLDRGKDNHVEVALEKAL